MSKTRSTISTYTLVALLSLACCTMFISSAAKAEAEIVPKYPGSTEDSTPTPSTEDVQTTALPLAPDGSTQTSNQILSPKTGVVSVGVVIFVIGASAAGIIYDRRRLSKIEAKRSEK